MKYFPAIEVTVVMHALLALVDVVVVPFDALRTNPNALPPSALPRMNTEHSPRGSFGLRAATPWRSVNAPRAQIRYIVKANHTLQAIGRSIHRYMIAEER